MKLQTLCYDEIRARFGLSSNLAQQVCRRVAGSRKVAKQRQRPVKAFKSGFVTYDARIFSFRESEGQHWDRQVITKVRDHFANLRARLQHKASKGTRSCRRRCRQLLQRLSGRERRFQSWINHNVSKRIVETAKALCASIALEDLTGIRERTNQQPRSKTERRRSNSWAFYQLRLFIGYKALRTGGKVILVNPAYTSQTCRPCLHIHPDPDQSYRSGKQFKCGHCGWQGDADFNGAKNIAAMGASVNRPGGPWLSCQITAGLLKAHAVA